MMENRQANEAEKQEGQDEERERLQEQLEEARRGKELLMELVQAGATDLEASLLVVQERAKEQEGATKDYRRMVAELRKEKPYLFRGEEGEAQASPTAGVRGRTTGGATMLGRLAEQAARTGRRKDMQEYLRARRSVRK